MRGGPVKDVSREQISVFEQWSCTNRRCKPHVHVLPTRAPPGADMLSELGQAETLACRVSKAATDLVERHPARGPVRSRAIGWGGDWAAAAQDNSLGPG